MNELTICQVCLFFGGTMMIMINSVCMGLLMVLGIAFKEEKGEV